MFDPLRKELRPNEQERLSACLSVRSSDAGAAMTYKKDHFEGEKWVYSDEIETSVENPEKTKNILQSIGMELLVTVAVQKTIYIFGACEIILEDVDVLGLFLEIEYQGSDPYNKVETIKEEMRKCIYDLQLEVREEENAGKPELLLRSGFLKRNK
ncbi:class IV adenylate cyclase [Candidatus Uhrbacteria bacterium]|nr:class IV adenylate cyclase [Candidatus Uhrbacteria bacterium]